MLKLLRLLVAISAAIVTSLSFLSTAGIAQDYLVCFLVTSSGQVVNLENLCQTQPQSQALQKAKACQGTFDSDGFPIALSGEWERLKAVVAEVKKGNDYAGDALEVQSSIEPI